MHRVSPEVAAMVDAANPSAFHEASQNSDGPLPETPRLAMRNVTKTFPGVRAVDDVGFEVRQSRIRVDVVEAPE